jgi:hypothetical protein
MGCCGNRRAELTHQKQAPATSRTGPSPIRASGRVLAEAVYFQYIGETALSVRGMISRSIYRFSAPGAVVAVDGRDAPSMTAVPNLKRVKPTD